ncbi:MAG: hypothetical protein JKY81_03730 [Colwellia sp.]|nr:hypothetical protein [Colwellia sp.]
MSALAHTRINNTNVAAVQLNSEPAVTSISVSARIDYIQRFSKQAVLVIDDDAEVYSQAASHFLANLSSSSSKEKTHQETNVAFVSASTKLNDIQMRCRLIEQLFANTLFDPEKSLAMSIFHLMKQSKGRITIVVEHAHALSLQIKYELCQLVDVANKTHNRINVVLFGKEQAAYEVAENKSIFTNKLAIIDAKSGQLFALEHAKFNNKNAIFTGKFWLKLVLVALVISTFIGLSWFALIKHDSFSISKLPLFNFMGIEQTSTKKTVEINNVLTVTNPVEQASVADIHAVLLGKRILAIKLEQKTAQTTDILQAIAFESSVEPKPLVVGVTSPNLEPTLVTVITTKPINRKSVNKSTITESAIQLTPDYYLNASTGYVIQITGFTDMSVLVGFINEYPSLEYFSYQRRLNEQLFTVLTSKVFADQIQAREALSALPQPLLKLGPWLKSISAIKREINTFKG